MGPFIPCVPPFHQDSSTHGHVSMANCRKPNITTKLWFETKRKQKPSNLPKLITSTKGIWVMNCCSHLFFFLGSFYGRIKAAEGWLQCQSGKKGTNLCSLQCPMYPPHTHTKLDTWLLLIALAAFADRLVDRLWNEALDTNITSHDCNYLGIFTTIRLSLTPSRSTITQLRTTKDTV